MTTTVIDIPLAKILPSPFNHRKKFDGLDELAASIREKGLISPITVRPAPKGRSEPPYELVAGERRWRATKLAGLDTIAAIVRELDDKAVLEVQLIENVQRADVHPLEEADGYRMLIDKHKHTAETLADKTGKSSSYIRARLKLCDLAPVPRKTFLEDRLHLSIALMIARIPDAKLQASATAEVLGEADYKDYEIEPTQIDEVDDKGKRTREYIPLSIKQAQIHLQRKYMLRLDTAPFDTADATLVPKAGACSACPHRTGNQRELFADVRSADVCTLPACYDAKKSADWTRRASAAKGAGERVLSEKEAKSVFEQYNGGVDIAYNSAYVDPKGALPYDLQTPKRKTWKDLLGTSTPATVVAKDGSGAARTLWDKQSAIATAKKSGAIKEAKAENKARSKAPDQYQLAQRKREAEAKLRHRVGRAAFIKLAAEKFDTGDPELWRFLAAAVLRMIDSEDKRNLCKRRDLDDIPLGSGKAEKALAAIVKAAPATDLPGLVVEFAAAYHAIGGPWAGSGGYGENFNDACKLAGVDIAKVKVELVKAEKAKAATKGKKPAKAKK